MKARDTMILANLRLVISIAQKQRGSLPLLDAIHAVLSATK